MVTLLKNYELVEGCVICASADREAIDAELDFDAEGGRQELGRIVRQFGVAFQPRELLEHIMHRTPPAPSAIVRPYYESEAYRASHPEEPEAPAPAPQAIIRVYAPLAEREDGRGYTVVLFEQDPAHPGGECFIYTDGKPAEVARTAAVAKLLRAGQLVEVKAVAE